MRKLSEIIEAAMPRYIERGEIETAKEKKCGEVEDNTPGMCVSVSFVATEEEQEVFRNWLKPKLYGNAFLADALRDQKKASSRAARLKWWQNQLRILKTKGL